MSLSTPGSAPTNRKGTPVRYQLHRTPTPAQQARWQVVPLPKGQRLSLRAIARKLGISRLPLRKNASAGGSAHQEPRDKGACQGGGPGRLDNRRRPNRVTLSLFGPRDRVADQQQTYSGPALQSPSLRCQPPSKRLSCRRQAGNQVSRAPSDPPSFHCPRPAVLTGRLACHRRKPDWHFEFYGQWTAGLV